MLSRINGLLTNCSICYYNSYPATKGSNRKAGFVDNIITSRRKELRMPTYNSYFEGAVQSLGFSLNGVDFTVGVLEPGEYEFEASRFELILVLRGALTDMRTGNVFDGMDNEGVHARYLPQFGPGEKVRLRCTEQVAYLCEYSDETFFLAIPKKR